MMSFPPLDAGIPLLTEIIVSNSESQETEPMASAPSSISDIAQTDEYEAATHFDQEIQSQGMEIPTDDTVREKLEQRISEKVLHQLFDRIDDVLEQQIRDRLADVLQIAIEDMTNHVRNGLQETLHAAIKRAVSQEISRMKKSE